MPLGTPPPKIQPASLNDYIEVMSKAVFQSGMSWRVVEAKWDGTRKAFQDFDIHKVANFHEGDLENLLKDTRVIRNERKLKAIIKNAGKIIDLERGYGSFQAYLRSQGDFGGLLAALRRDFKFMGPTGCYYFLYVVGEQVPSHEEFEANYR